MIRLWRRRPTHTAGDEAREAGRMFVPERIEVGARHLITDGEHVTALVVTGYPRQVHPGWLDPLASYPGRLDVSLHVEPVDPSTAAERLRRRLARLEAGRRHSAAHGQLADPEVDAAAGDAQDLADRLARGESRLFRVGLYLVVHAPDEAGLAEAVAAVRALAASMLLDARVASYRQVAGWTSCLPVGIDALRVHRAMDTDAISASFPFTSPDPPPPDPASAGLAPGVVYGLNLGSSGLVTVDRWGQPNHNMIVLGSSGAGKSYLVKIDLLRSLYAGVHGLVVDPEGEYAHLTQAVGGTVVPLGQRGVHLNPLDLPLGSDGYPTRDAYTQAALFVQTVVAVLLGDDPDPEQRAALDAAVTATYAGAGITDDPRTWTRPAPLLGHLAATLADPTGPAGDAGRQLAGKLRPYVTGAYAGLFAGPTTVRPTGHLITFDLRALPEQTRPLGTLLALDAIWRHVSHPTHDPTGRPRPRIVVVDEAWTLLQTRAGGAFLARMARSSRRHLAGLTIATQDAADVLSSDLGRAVIHNAATQVLLRQSTQVIDEVVAAFGLTHGERDFLLRAGQGQGIIATAGRRMAVQTVASPGTEHALITTDLREQTPEAGTSLREPRW